jgi:hypothetical protein
VAEYDLTPIIVEDDAVGTYELMRRYFLRENNPFNIASDYTSEDGFTIDIMRSYSFIASEHRATVHLAGIPQEDGTTKVTLHARSVEEPDRLEREIRDRIAEAMRRAVAEKNNNPIEDPVETEAEKKRTKVELIVVGIIAALIIIGTLPISCSETFSRFWIF